MNEIFSMGDLPNAFYITPSVAIINDDKYTILQMCIFKWFLDITLKSK